MFMRGDRVPAGRVSWTASIAHDRAREGPMLPRLASALTSVVLLTSNAQALTDLRGVRMELPNLFAEATPLQIVENVASANLNAILCTVHPSVLKDPRFSQLLAA